MNLLSPSASLVFPVFLQGLVLSLGLIVAIGAQNAFVLRQGLRREHVASVVLFCAVADALLITAGVLGMAQALPVEVLVDALIATAHQVGPFDLHHVPVDVAGIGHHLDAGHFAVVLALDQLAAVLGAERFEDRLILGFLTGAAIADYNHLRRRLRTA